MKNTYNLVSDIYNLVSTKDVAEGVDIESCMSSLVRTSRTSCVRSLQRSETTHVNYVCPT